MKIKAISIDFWETLVAGMHNSSQRVAHRIDFLKITLQNYGDFDDKNIELVYEQTGKLFSDVWKFSHKTITSGETINAIANRLGVTFSHLDFIALVEIFEKSVLKNPPLLFPELQTVLPKLAKKYPLGIISDTGYSSGIILREFLRQNNVFQYFTSFVFSDEVHAAKPQSKNYLVTCKNFGISCEELLHVGDNQRSDIVGIQNLGGKGILFCQTNKKHVSKTTADEIIFNWNDVFEAIERIEQK